MSVKEYYLVFQNILVRVERHCFKYTSRLPQNEQTQMHRALEDYMGETKVDLPQGYQ